MSELVIVKGKEIFTTSLALSEGVKIEHQNVMALIKKYSNIEELSTFETCEVRTKGRPLTIVYLTELQATLLIVLMKNSPEVLQFKVTLTKAFFKQRKLLQKLLSQKENTEWLEERNNGKITRLQETDTIKKFVNYATDQGSSNAMRYYGNLTKMENSALFYIEQKFDNMRDVMNLEQLDLIKVADKAIERSLENSMLLGLPYKECFQKAKEKIEALADVVGKSTIPALLENKKLELNHECE